MIINVTGSLSIGAACEINVTGGDIESVIINVVGAKPTVKIKPDAIVGPAILAPGRKMLVATNASTANVYAASGKIKGAQIVETLLCP